MRMKIKKSLLNVLKNEGYPLGYSIRNAMDQVHENTQIDIDHNDLPPGALDYIAEYIAEHKQNLDGIRGIQRTITMLRKIEEHPDTTPISNLELLAKALTKVVSKTPNRWVFMTTNGFMQPYLVKDIAYYPTSRKYEQPQTTMTLMYIRHFENAIEHVVWCTDDMKRATIGTMLERQNVTLATDEMIEEYKRAYHRYLKFQKLWGAQFLVTGTGYPAKERYFRENQVMDEAGPGKAVNDGETQSYKVKSTEIVSSFWDDVDNIQDETVQRSTYIIPTHPYLCMFHLELHAQYWVHVDNLELYRYNANLRDKLILPSEIRDLIDILTQSLDEVFDDIVEGKSGGTIVLCRGNPGTGKTLTAEVYAEIIEKPLYKVQSGQLGLDSEDLEEKLKEILLRAARWDAVLLIDECDVYVHERGTNVRQNAVVGVFLRVLEYYSGLLFMTTNKMSREGKIDIDDAILRRCTAIIDYRNPKGTELIQIWRVLSKAAHLPLPDELIVQLAHKWPDLPGGSVKSLLKLVKRWTQCYNEEPTFDTFVHMSQYAHLGGAKVSTCRRKLPHAKKVGDV